MDNWFEAPPCLITLIKDEQTITQSGKRNAFFNLCLYLQKRYGHGWRMQVSAYLHYFNPPMRSDEMREVNRWINRHRHDSYLCDRSPCREVCDRATCETRRFGVPAPPPPPAPVNVRECLVRARRFYVEGDASYARLAIVRAAQGQDVQVQRLAFAAWVHAAVFYGKRATTRDRTVTLKAFDLAIREAIE